MPRENSYARARTREQKILTKKIASNLALQVLSARTLHRCTLGRWTSARRLIPTSAGPIVQQLEAKRNGPSAGGRLRPSFLGRVWGRQQPINASSYVDRFRSKSMVAFLSALSARDVDGPCVTASYDRDASVRPSRLTEYARRAALPRFVSPAASARHA
jgi:hypothetical protein